MGPSLVHLHFNSPWMGRGVMIQYVLPLEPMLQKVVHLFYTEPSWWSAYAKMVLWGESVLLERDITVWNSKTYADHPVAGTEDGLLSRHRRWYNQFYPLSPKRFSNSKQEQQLVNEGQERPSSPPPPSRRRPWLSSSLDW